MMTAYGSVDTAVEAMKRGAYHFVTKPLNIDELEILIKRALRSREMEDENAALQHAGGEAFRDGEHHRGDRRRCEDGVRDDRAGGADPGDGA